MATIEITAPTMSQGMRMAADYYMEVTMKWGVSRIIVNGVERTKDVVWLSKYIYG